MGAWASDLGFLVSSCGGLTKVQEGPHRSAHVCHPVSESVNRAGTSRFWLCELRLASAQREPRTLVVTRSRFSFQTLKYAPCTILQAMPTLTQRAHGDVQTSVGKLGSSSSKVSMTATPLDFGNLPQNALEIKVKVPKWYELVRVILLSVPVVYQSHSRVNCGATRSF